MNRSLTAWLGVFLRGLAMGIAEVIPGVSGGTIAFVTGIYTELLSSIAALGPQAMWDLIKKGPVYFWSEYNMTFLLVLFAGMALSILSFAKLVLFLLASYPLYLWSFFFGLICISVILISRQASRKHLFTIGLSGLLLGAALSLSGAVHLSPSLPMLFLAGMVAVSAWVLPGISGSYILLILGLYSTVLSAVNAFNLGIIAAVGAGCGVGLLLFSRLLSWMLLKYKSAVMALLSGFTAGSLVKLWPWQDVVVEGTGESQGTAQTSNPLLPWDYADVTGADPQIAGVLLCFLIGAVVVFLVHKQSDVSTG